MHAERIRRWVNALESGHYEQGTGQLRDDDDRYCCLGVYCEVVHASEGIGEWWINEDGVFAFHVGGSSSEAYLPRVLAPDFDDQTNPILRSTAPHRERREAATALNDSVKLSFAQIAQCVRDTYPEIFA